MMTTNQAAKNVPIGEALTELDEGLLALIRHGMAKSTQSVSSLSAIPTGNAYQSVALRGETMRGFRRADPHLFAGIPLRGVSFVDLGCNFGEKTRLAALAGAEYAEGIEYEEYFVRIGGLISVYNRASNVTIRQGDLTRPGCLTRSFDVAGCFSAFVYMRENLAEIASRIRDILVLETHAMDDTWYGQYVPPLEVEFPFWVFLGYTDHAENLTKQRRGLMAFSRMRPQALDVSVGRGSELDTTHHDVVWLDLVNSPRTQVGMGENGRTHALFSALRDDLSAVPAGNVDGVVASLRRIMSALGPLLSEPQGSDGGAFGTDRYWYMLLKGLLHMVTAGQSVSGTNPYVQFLMNLAGKGSYDSDMSFELSTEELAVARLRPRLESVLKTLVDKKLEHPLVAYNPLPTRELKTRGYDVSRAEVALEHVVIEGKGEHRIQYLDGNHRLAALWLSGAKACPIIPVWTNVFGFGQKDFPLFDATDKHTTMVQQLIAETALAF